MLTLGKVDKKIGQRAELIERIAHHATSRRIGINVPALRGAHDDPIQGPLDKRSKCLNPHVSRVLAHHRLDPERLPDPPQLMSARAPDLRAQPTVPPACARSDPAWKGCC